MTRLAPLVLVAAAALAVTACGRPASDTRRQQGSTEVGASPGTASTAPADSVPVPTGSPAPNSGGGNAGGPGRPASSPVTGGGTGPRVVSFSATGAVCPVVAKPGAPFSRPGQVTVTWKISGAGGVDLLMDKGLWRSYTGTQGSDTLPFACPDTSNPATHSYTLTVKGTAVSRTVSATARPNP